MRFSVWPSTNQSWDDILDVARHAELSGWDRVYVADHFMPNGPADDLTTSTTAPMLECWSVVTALATAVPRIGIGTLVCGTTYRHPAVLVNQATTADVISGGRIILGLGAGWQINEHEAYGIDLGSLTVRMDRFEEACEVVRSLIDHERTTFDGQYYQLHDAPMSPKPTGAMPLLIGGGGEQRTLRITARFAQEWNVWSDPDLFAHKSAVLDARCEEIDRDPATIHRSTQALLFLSEDTKWSVDAAAKARAGGMKVLAGSVAQVTETVAAYRDAGVDEFIVPDFNLGTGARRAESLERFNTEVAIHFDPTS